ncbi:hypothetical protein Mapa_011953 [Marchantia paleacea]|nr:hypothetical protein Mapa_011953 [Marchantia paleacea]
MGRETSKLSRGRAETAAAAAMEEGSKSSSSPPGQKWACSSLSSSDKFSSFYDKVLEGSGDWDQKNIESLVCSQYLQQSAAQPAVPKPRSKIVFPHIMTRGSVVGNKVYCKTSINNCFTWRQRSSSLCAAGSSMMFVNFYHERSSDIQSGIAKIAPDEEEDESEPPSSSDSEDAPKSDHHPVINKQCRTLLFSVAGAAGMQLICPALRLPLLEVLLFSHQKWPTSRRATLFNRAAGRDGRDGRRGGGGGWWRFPLNLALAVSRPFCGSLLRRSLTAVLLVLQLRIKKKMEQRSARYMPDLYSMMLLEKGISVDRELNLSSEFLNRMDESTDAEFEDLSWERHTSTTCSENGDDSVHVEELMEADHDCSDDDKGPAAAALEQDVISDDGLSTISAGSLEQDVISDDGLSSSGDSSDQDVLSDEEKSSISSSLSLVDLDREMDEIDLGHLSDGSPESSAESSIIPRPCDSASAQPYHDSPERYYAETSLETRSPGTLPTSEDGEEAQLTCTSDFFTSSVKGSSSSSGRSSSSGSSCSETSSVVSADDTEKIGQKLWSLIEQEEDGAGDSQCTADSTTDAEDPLSPRESSSSSTSESSFSSERRTVTSSEAKVEDSAGTSRAEGEEKFHISEELHLLEHDSSSLSPSSSAETISRENFGLFVRASSSGGLLEVDGLDTEEYKPEPPTKSLELSPRADLTALTSEDYDSGSADGTWEIEVDGLAEDPIYSVVWTPFADKRRAKESQSDDSEFTADDTEENCPSAGGSQMGRDEDGDEQDDGEDEDEGIPDEGRLTRKNVQNADSRREDGRPSDAVQDWQKLDDCVQIESYNKFLCLDFKSVARCLEADLKSVTDNDDNARDARECMPRTASIRENELEEARPDCEVQSVDDGLRKSEAEAETAEIYSACERDGNILVEAAMPRIKLTVFLDGEERSGLREVIPGAPEQSSDASTENSLTSRQDVSPGPHTDSRRRESLAAEESQSEDDCNVDATGKGGNSQHPSAWTAAAVVQSDSEKCVRVSEVEHVDGARTVTPQLQEDKSVDDLGFSSSSSLEVTDEVDTSVETRAEGNSVSTETSSDSPDASTSSSSSSAASLFADHPTCLNLRKLRHSHGDQSYLELPELLSRPWSGLVYWHGRCQEGRPTLVVLLGKAVRQLSSSELKHFITVTISHAEYAELNYYNGAVKQMNILMDLDGLGFMRLPPMHVMQSIGTILNRDYAGRGGWIFLINAPMMLGLVMSAIQRVILRPSYTKGAVIDKGFLEGKERIVTLGGRYKSTLLKHFDEEMLPSTLGGACPCGSNEARQCSLGVDFVSH